MRTTQSLSITLPHEMSQLVKDKVASGEYVSESEVIRDGLRTISASDAGKIKLLADAHPAFSDLQQLRDERPFWSHQFLKRKAKPTRVSPFHST